MSTEYVKCPQCGNSDFKAPAGAQPDDIVTCTQCGFTTTYADLRARLDKLVEQAKADAITKLREGLKKIW